MATNEQRKVIDLLIKSSETGVAVVNEKNAFSNGKRAFDITFLATDSKDIQATLVVDRAGEIAFYERATASLSEGVKAGRRLDSDTSSAYSEKLGLQNHTLAPERQTLKAEQRATITMLDRFFIKANSSESTQRIPEDKLQPSATTFKK